MDNTIWSKTILSVYRYLKRVAFAYNNIVKAKANNSFYTSGDNYSINNVWNVSNSILDITERKISLINLKILTEKALTLIDKKNSKILILKYIHNKKSEEIAEMLGICPRTYFRRVNIAHKSFEKALLRLGYTHDKLYKMLQKEDWIIEVYKQYLSEQNDLEIEVNFYETSIRKTIYKQLKSVNSFF